MLCITTDGRTMGGVRGAFIIYLFICLLRPLYVACCYATRASIKLRRHLLASKWFLLLTSWARTPIRDRLGTVTLHLFAPSIAVWIYRGENDRSGGLNVLKLLTLFVYNTYWLVSWCEGRNPCTWASPIADRRLLVYLLINLSDAVFLQTVRHGILTLPLLKINFDSQTGVFI